MWCSDGAPFVRPPRVVFVLGCVSLINTLTSGKISAEQNTMFAIQASAWAFAAIAVVGLSLNSHTSR